MKNILCLAVAFFLFACDSLPTQAQPTLPQQEWTVGGQKILVEVADEEIERRIGLMYREKLPEGTGMVFVWEKAEPRVFWMKNTIVPLDMIFILDDKVVGVVENAEPYSTNHYHVGEVPANAVLEVPAGYAKKHNIRVGSLVQNSSVN